MDNLTDSITYDRALSLLKELVQTPSISKKEQDLAELINEKCLEMGLESKIDRHGNVIAYKKGSKGSPVVALNSHMDTVDVGDSWTKEPFAAEVKEGKMYGLGTCDCKGSMAGMLLALEAIQKQGVELNGDLYFTAVVQEEVQDENAKGTVKLIKDGFKADMVIVGEPTKLQICLGCEGMTEVEVVTTGIPVHSSNAEKGVNAITQMMKVISEVEKMEPGYHKVVGKGSICPGVITGGLRSSVVPDKCTLKIARYVVPGETGPAFLAEVEEILDKLRKQDGTFRGRARLTYNSNAGVIDEDEPVVDILKAAHLKAIGSEARVMGMRAHLDSDFLINMAGIPTAVLGPGDISMAHEGDEFIVIDDVAKAAKIYAYSILEALKE